VGGSSVDGGAFFDESVDIGDRDVDEVPFCEGELIEIAGVFVVDGDPEGRAHIADGLVGRRGGVDLFELVGDGGREIGEEAFFEEGEACNFVE
jgi:hypothetical protein